MEKGCINKKKKFNKKQNHNFLIEIYLGKRVLFFNP